MKTPSLLVETDILAEFLLNGDKTSELRALLSTHRCYTTFIQMAEILSCAGTPEEHAALMQVFIGVRVLGFHNRYASRAAKFLHEQKTRDLRGALTAAIAFESKLPIYTHRFTATYKNLGGISTIEEI